MSRAWRTEYEGAYYHVLSRGNERKDVFYVGVKSAVDCFALK